MDVWADPADLPTRRSEKWRHHPPDVLPAWVAEMDVVLAEPVRAALADAVARSDTGYPHPGGVAEAFAGFAARRYGWPVAPERVGLAPDVARATTELLRVLTAPGDGVVINPPVYPPFFAWIASTGRRVVASPLARDGGGWTLDLDRLAADYAGGARVHLLCNPHNPTGLVLSPGQLAAVAELADRHGVRLVVDEIHAPLTHAPAVHTPFGSLDAPAARSAFTLVSASKAWNLAGLKCALIVAGPDAVRDLAALPVDTAESAGHLGVLGTEAAFAAGDAWLDAVLDALDANRRLLAALIPAHLPGVRFHVPDATYLAWLDLRACGLGDDPAAAILERGRVALSRGLDFGPEGAGFARLNFGTAPPLVREAVRRTATALSR